MRLIEKIRSRFKVAELRGEYKIIWKFLYNNAAAYVLIFLQNYLINRYMPDVLLGQYSYAHSMLVLFSSIYSMEAYSAYLRFVGVNNEKKLRKQMSRILLVASALFSLTVLLFFRKPLYILFFGYMWMYERLYFFRAKMEINTYGRIKIFHYLLSTVALVLLIMTGTLSEDSLLTCMGLSYLAIALLYRWNGKARRTEVNKDTLPEPRIGEIIKYALPLSFNAVVVWLLGAADQLLINNYLDAMTLTYYAAGFRIISVIRIGVGVIMEYWPRFYFENMEKKAFHSVKTMWFLFQGVVTALCIGSILLSKPLYWIMGAGRYQDYRWMFCLLATAELFRQWGSINMTFQSFVKNNTINVVCLSVLGALKLLINWQLIQTSGVTVLLGTSVACYLLYFLCSLWFGCKSEKKYISKMTNP